MLVRDWCVVSFGWPIAATQRLPSVGGRTDQRTSVGEDHGPALQIELALGVANDRRRQARGGTALARRVYAHGSDLGDEFEKLGLGHGGVAQQQDVDVAAQTHAVVEFFATAAQQLTRQCFFNVHRVGSGNVRRNGSLQNVVHFGVATQRAKGLFFGRSKGHGLAVRIIVLEQAHDAEIDRFGGFLVVATRRHGCEEGRNAPNRNARSRGRHVHQASFGRQEDGAGHFSRRDSFWRFLQFERLLIDEFGFVGDGNERVGCGRTLGVVASLRKGNAAKGAGSRVVGADRARGAASTAAYEQLDGSIFDRRCGNDNAGAFQEPIDVFALDGAEGCCFEIAAQ